VLVQASALNMGAIQVEGKLAWAVVHSRSKRSRLVSTALLLRVVRTGARYVASPITEVATRPQFTIPGLRRDYGETAHRKPLLGKSLWSALSGYRQAERALFAVAWHEPPRMTRGVPVRVGPKGFFERRPP
ncbi:MAG: hypothetical protein MUQ30_21050, partial [Anaerolineae bacterium]|nr:hypothetical protein [Anaerolineae bacterium]